jgi:Holliday junction resolvase RusA-like endonuclease
VTPTHRPRAPLEPLHLVLRGVPRSGKNSQRRLQLGDGRRISVKSKAAQKWLDRAVIACRLQAPRARPVEVAVTLTVLIKHARPLRSWDADNVLNLVQDALVAARILDDDCAAIVREVRLLADDDRADPRVEVLLEQMDILPPATLAPRPRIQPGGA